MAELKFLLACAILATVILVSLRFLWTGFVALATNGIDWRGWLAVTAFLILVGAVLWAGTIFLPWYLINPVIMGVCFWPVAVAFVLLRCWLQKEGVIKQDSLPILGRKRDRS